MKTNLLSFFLTLCTVSTNAQCLVSTINLNTGYNPVTGTALPSGGSASPSLDPHWIVVHATSSVPGAASPGSPAYVIPRVTSAWVANPSANPGNWISVIDTNTYSTDGAGTAYNMTLGRPFRLCSDDSITFTLHIADDNWISIVDVDGTTLGYTEYCCGTYYFSSFSSYTQTLFLTAGTHQLNVLVNNYNDSYYIGDNPTGLDIYGTISSATGASSIVKESDTTCNSYACMVIDTVCNTIALADSAIICDSGSVLLTAIVSGPDSIINIHWSPSFGISDTSILNPTLHTGFSSRWYNIDVQSLMFSNLVYNGNFSLGNTGFSSSYTYSAPPSTILYEGDYSVYTNPHGVHTGFTSFGDHTTGTGSMLIVNGGASASDVWCETVSVTPYTNYVFSAWVADCSSVTTGTYVPIMQYKINGSLIGTPDTISATVGTWVNFRANWYSGTSTTANICIYDALTATTGNDFALDDISFQQFCTAKDSIYVLIKIPDTVFSKYDTTFCSSAGSITLNANAGYSSYLWNNGTTSSSNTVGASGTYYVNCSGTCKEERDSFDVNVIPYSLTTEVVDTTFCFPGTLLLTAPSGETSYAWQNGITNSHFQADSAGIYYVDASSFCVDLIDTFHVSFSNLSFSLGPDTTVCMNYPITVPIKGPGVSYLWQDGTTDSSYSADHTGIYFVTVHQNECVASDTVNVTFFNLQQNIPDTFVCKGDKFEYKMQCNVPDGASVMWDDGITSPTRYVSDSGTWWVMISKNQCEILDTVHVVSGYCDCWYNVPGGFTPNGDGLNDVFRPTIQPGCTVSGYLFNIYNRWGELVFSTDIQNKGWDGIYKGVPADIDVYMYSLQFFIGVNNTLVKTSGDVTLIR